jgi:ABC-type dipeptide/oligopeptide/nickel transport system permease component
VVPTPLTLFAAVVVMLNLLTDVLYSWFDPRTRQT